MGMRIPTLPMVARNDTEVGKSQQLSHKDVIASLRMQAWQSVLPPLSLRCIMGIRIPTPVSKEILERMRLRFLSAKLALARNDTEEGKLRGNGFPRQCAHWLGMTISAVQI